MLMSFEFIVRISCCLRFRSETVPQVFVCKMELSLILRPQPGLNSLHVMFRVWTSVISFTAYQRSEKSQNSLQ